jgi:formylglycine-generating enzyme required for sulfatase activity
MRQILLFIISGIFIQSVFGQDKQTAKYLSKMDFLPIKGNYLFIQSNEVSNLQYSEFIFWLNKFASAKTASIMHPDTLVWRSSWAFNEPYVKYYYQHVAYHDYPVVGISYFQAVYYCNWMAQRIMGTPEFKGSNIEKIKIRLPSEEEWMLAARGGLPETAIYPWEGNTIRWENGKKKDLGKIRLNVKRDKGDACGIASQLNDAGFITTPVDSYWPNGFGLYNMCGNVAELIEEKNKAKGGSWNSFPYNARIDVVQATFGDSISTSTIGFRPLLEIVSFKNNPKIKPLNLNAKAIEKQIKLFNDSMGVAIYETTNELYNLYLTETKNLADSVHSFNWIKYSRYQYLLNYNQFTGYNQFPVVNISYESTVHFCEWLTKKYNQLEHRTYKEVVFKLPTEQEWELAAEGNRKYAPYPWGGPYTRNSIGNYLANFNPLEEEYLYKDSSNRYYFNYPNGDSTISRGCDGDIFTARTDSYFPNSFGLYNCSGNVAEMIEQKGVSKGGSWTSSQNYIQIRARETYENPDANLGFRFVMLVKKKW